MERPRKVDQAVGDSEGANLDVGEEVDLSQLASSSSLATGPQGVGASSSDTTADKRKQLHALIIWTIVIILDYGQLFDIIH